MGDNGMEDLIEGIAPSTEQGGGDAALKARCAELERELQRERVEQGRLKKANERIAELEGELSKARDAKRENRLDSCLTEDERDRIPEEILSVAKKLVRNGMDAVSEEQQREMALLREAQMRSRKEDFMRRVEAVYPGFWGSVSAGGDKAEAWRAYLAKYRASVESALAAGDAASFNGLVEDFYRNSLGLRTPSGTGDGSAAPEPRANGGGHGGVQTAAGKVYSRAEWEALPDRAETLRDRGDYAGCRALYAEYEKAPAEGRVQ